jgi:hypothetical protein
MLATDPRRKNPFEKPSEHADLTLGELVAMFIGTPNPETSALLAVIAEMAADDLLRTRIRRELATRPRVGPPWLGHLSEAETYRVVRMHHVLDDGDNIILGVRMHGRFRWAGIAEDVRGRVQEVLTLSDQCCDELLDVEYRTACRRILARAASGGPEVFRRKGSLEMTAAAVVWIVGKVNDQFHQFAPGLKAKDLMSHFGLRSSASQRAAALLDAAGFECKTHDLVLGSTDYPGIGSAAPHHQGP